MLVALRTYRSVAALMASMLLLGGLVPIVQHACAMSNGRGANGHEMAAPRPCCCPEGAEGHAHGHAGHDVAASTKHAGHDAHAGNEPCAHESPADATPDRIDACCQHADATQLLTAVTAPERPLYSLHLPRARVLADALASPEAARQALPTADRRGPPALHVSLQVLHATFLI